VCGGRGASKCDVSSAEPLLGFLVRDEIRSEGGYVTEHCCPPAAEQSHAPAILLHETLRDLDGRGARANPVVHLLPHFDELHRNGYDALQQPTPSAGYRQFKQVLISVPFCVCLAEMGVERTQSMPIRSEQDCIQGCIEHQGSGEAFKYSRRLQFKNKE